ncbi:MAG: hypothetical protein WC227_03125 [Patescibacteria group bacterium]|jgi:hypothetical protein
MSKKLKPGQFRVIIDGRMPEADPAMDLLRTVVLALGAQLEDANMFARSMAREANRSKGEGVCHCGSAPKVSPPKGPAAAPKGAADNYPPHNCGGEDQPSIGEAVRVCKRCKTKLRPNERGCWHCGAIFERRKGDKPSDPAGNGKPKAKANPDGGKKRMVP